MAELFESEKAIEAAVKTISQALLDLSDYATPATARKGEPALKIISAACSIITAEAASAKAWLKKQKGAGAKELAKHVAEIERDGKALCDACEKFAKSPEASFKKLNAAYADLVQVLTLLLSENVKLE